MAYRIPLRMHDAPATEVQVDSDTMVIRVDGYSEGIQRETIAVEPYRPNFRKRYQDTEQYRIKWADNLTTLTYWPGHPKRQEVPDDDAGKRLCEVHAEKLSRVPVDSHVAFKTDGKWNCYKVLPYPNIEQERRLQAKELHKEAYAKRKHERRPTLLERVLSGIFPDD